MMEKENCKKVSIFGSCVTRDLFEYDMKKFFSIEEYIARQSIISFLSTPININEHNIQLESDFQKKQLISDLNKNAFQRLKSSASDLLIIDLIEERFKIGKIRKTYFTLSSEFTQSKLFVDDRIKTYEKKLCNGKIYFKLKDIKKYINNFAKMILEIYLQEQIIIHEVYLANYYLGEDGKKKEFARNYIGYNLRVNKILEYMYACLKQAIPYASVLSISSEYIADEKHKWGLAPMHFQEEYYKRAMAWLYDFLE